MPSKKDATGTMLAANLRRFIVPDYQQVKLQDALKPKHWLRSRVMAFEASAPDAKDPAANDYYWRKAGILDISAHLALGKNAAAAKLIDQMPDKSAGRQGWLFDEERVEDAAWKAARKKLTQLRKTL